jgi:hypothetical protein
LGLLLIAAALLGIAAAVLVAYRRPPQVSFTVLSLGELPWRTADHTALTELFATTRSATNLTQAALVRELKNVENHKGQKIVYISALAKRDAQGRVYLLPTDADPDDPATWLSLARVDELLGPKRLLILDLAGDAYGEPREGPTLYAASAGQSPLFSEYRGRSIFGYYVELGLRGQADTNGDGRVSAAELAEYVRQRVDRWSRRVRGVRQTPELQGKGVDFDLAEARSEARPADLPEPREYPKWLAEAWTKSSAMLPIERAWREGEAEAMLQERAKAVLAQPPPEEKRPPVRSLALLPPPSDTAIETMRRFATTKPLGVETFVKENKPTAELLAAAVVVATEEPDTLPALVAWLSLAEPRSEYVDTLMLLRVARLNLPATQAKSLLQALRDSQALLVPRGFARRRAQVEQATQALHDALVLWESRGYASASLAEKQLAVAQAQLAALLARQTADLRADDALGLARRLFPEVLAAGRDTGLTQALQHYDALERKLAGPPGNPSAEITALRAALVPLAEPFTPEGVSKRIREAKRADSPDAWRELDGLLATSLISARAEVYAAAQDLGRRLEEENDRLDDRDGRQLEGIPDAEPRPPRDLPALPSEPETDTSLWAWLADHYRYEMREAFALDPQSPAAQFYARAAADYRPWLDRPRETFVEIIEQNDPPRLLPGETIDLELQARAVPEGKPELTLFRADNEWLNVTPEQPLMDEMGQFSLRVRLRQSAGTGSAPPPAGVLVRASLGGRSFHRRLGVSLTPRVPQVVIVPEGATPTDSTARLGLRAVPGRQAFQMYLRNPIDKPWSKLAVRLTAGTEMRESLPIPLAGLETKAIDFPAATAPPPPVLPEVRSLGYSVVNLDAKGEEVASGSVVLDLANPATYARITSLDYNPKTERLTVRLRQRASIAGPPVSAELNIPPPDQGGATFRQGTLRGVLSPKGEELTLFAEGVRGDGPARFAVGVDGWARAFPFRATLTARGGAALPEPLPEPAIRLQTGPFGVAGPDFRVPIEVDNAPPGVAVEVAIGRISGGSFREEVNIRREQGRESRIGFALQGKMLEFETQLRDWTIPLDTSRIRGPRTLRARLLSSGGRELARDERPITLGDEAPAGVRFINPPESAWNKAALPLVASGADPVVGVKEVFFFVGKPVMDKLPEGVFKAVAQRRADGNYEAKLPLPADRKGPTDITVGMTNAVGLTAFASHNVDLRDEDPAKTKPATIRGKITESDRPQSGIEIVLSDEKGEEKARVKSDDDGNYVFADVPPGKYRLSATKSRTSRKAAYPRDKPTFEVMPGAMLSIDLVLFL